MCRYEYDTVHAVAKGFGSTLDVFLYGLQPHALLMFWGDLKGMRAGAAKVMDGHRKLLAQVQQGHVTAAGCAGSRMAAAHRRC